MQHVNSVLTIESDYRFLDDPFHDVMLLHDVSCNMKENFTNFYYLNLRFEFNENAKMRL